MSSLKSCKERERYLEYLKKKRLDKPKRGKQKKVWARNKKVFSFKQSWEQEPVKVDGDRMRKILDKITNKNEK